MADGPDDRSSKPEALLAEEIAELQAAVQSVLGEQKQLLKDP